MTITALQMINIVVMAGFCGHAIAKKDRWFLGLFLVIATLQIIAIIGGEAA